MVVTHTIDTGFWFALLVNVVIELPNHINSCVLCCLSFIVMHVFHLQIGIRPIG